MSEYLCKHCNRKLEYFRCSYCDARRERDDSDGLIEIISAGIAIASAFDSSSDSSSSDSSSSYDSGSSSSSDWSGDGGDFSGGGASSDW